jgi:hypothetical protein
MQTFIQTAPMQYYSLSINSKIFGAGVLQAVESGGFM